MGLDLTIMPVRPLDGIGGMVLGYERLQFGRDSEFFDVLKDKVPVHPLPSGVKVGIYGDEGLRETRENPYGEEMVYAMAGEMGNFKHPETHQKNEAILAYIKALPENTPIILEWR